MVGLPIRQSQLAPAVSNADVLGITAASVGAYNQAMLLSILCGDQPRYNSYLMPLVLRFPTTLLNGPWDDDCYVYALTATGTTSK